MSALNSSSPSPKISAGAQPNLSLIDGMACLQAVAGSETPYASRRLAEDLGLNVTRVSRLLKTLQFLGFVEQDRSRKYRPGPALHVLAAQSLFGSRLLSIALPYLERLSRHGHVVALGVLWREQVAYLYHQPPGIRPAEAIGRAGLFPARESAIGLALLAHFPREDADDTLRRELKATRERGYADFQPAPDQRRIGVSLGDPHPLAALALSGAIADSALPNLLDEMQSAATDISAILAGKPLTPSLQPALQNVKDERAA